MFKSLQMGRGIAALAVCAFHFSLYFHDARFGGEKLWSEVTAYGRHGVDFFFALSGFIIMFAHHRDMNRPDRLPRYAAKRFFRIYPMYWLLTAATLLAMAQRQNAIQPALGDLLTWVSLVRFTAAHPPLIPAWTLFHEVFFYSMFGLLMWRRNVGIAATVLWLVLIFLFGGKAGDSLGAFSRFVVAPVNLCFFGGILAYGLHTRLSLQQARLATAFGSLVLVCAVTWVPESTFPIGLPLSMGFAFCLVIGGVVAMERHGGVRDVKWLSVVGEASYTLYLSHGLLMAALMKSAYLLGLVPILGRPMLFVVVLCATTALAVLVHIHVEKPLQGFCARRWLKPSPPIPPLAA